MIIDSRTVRESFFHKLIVSRVIALRGIDPILRCSPCAQISKVIEGFEMRRAVECIVELLVLGQRAPSSWGQLGRYWRNC